jgi:hypothetical protein
MLLTLIVLFQIALTFKTLIVPFLEHYFYHNMFVVIGWDNYFIQQSLMMMILLSYHITNNILKFFQTVYLTIRLTSIYHPQIGGNFAASPGGPTNHFYGCIGYFMDQTSQHNYKQVMAPLEHGSKFAPNEEVSE